MKFNAGDLVYVLKFEVFLIWHLNREQNILAYSHWPTTEEAECTN